jgi:hypothetical protein
MENNISKINPRQRSPDYPYYNLKDCISFLTKYREKNKFNKAYVDSAISAMGFSTKGSTGNRVIASLLNYGLFQSEGAKDKRLLQPTRLAQEILLEKEGTSHFNELLQQAAQNDGTTRMMLSIWGDNIPTEETIKRYLFLNMKFSEEGARRCAEVFSANYDYVNLKDYTEKPMSDVTTNTMGENTQEERHPRDNEIPKFSGPSESVSSIKIRKANFLLPGDDREIIISVPSDLTEEEFSLSLKWLEFQKFGLVKKDTTIGKTGEELPE